MDHYSDTDPSTEGSNLVTGNVKVTETRPARARQADTTGTQTHERNRNSPRSRTKAPEKKPQGVRSRSPDYSDEWEWESPVRRHHRHRGFPDTNRAPYARDSGYYGSTIAYPWSSWDHGFHGGYPGYAGPGPLVPTPNTGAIVPQINPYYDLPGHLGPYPPGTSALPSAGYYGTGRLGMTGLDGAVALRKTRLPGVDENAGPPGTLSLNDIDVVWNVSSTKDVTLHLELDVEDDIDTNLGEFIRFTRRGDYKRAEQYYQDNLACHSEQPEVVLEYVRMLVEKGAYKTIRTLGIDEVGLADVCRSPTAPKAVQAVQLLLLLHKARSLSEPDMQATSTALLAARELVASLRIDQEEAEEPQPLTPTVIQLLRLYVDLAKTAGLEAHRMINLPPVDAILSLSLRTTYTNLLSDSRCWEIRDTVITSIKLFGLRETLSEIFPAISTVEAFSRLTVDWGTMERDELSDLALLDILNYINGYGDEPRHQGVPPSPDVDIAHQKAADLARTVAASIKASNPQLMKSRSYLEWLLLEERKERHKTQDANVKGLTPAAFGSFPGKILSLRDAFVYVPANSENPGWPVSSPTGSGDKEPESQLVSVARMTAQELGNYNLEAYFLHELTCRSLEPEKYLTELEQFHISVRGNQLSLLKTRLMRYLTVANSNEETRRLLKSQLLELDPRLQGIWGSFSHPMWEWAYRKVLFALMCSLGERDTEQAMAVYHQGQAMLPFLPWSARDTPDAEHYEHYGHYGPMNRERDRMRYTPRRTFRSPSPPPLPRPARQQDHSRAVFAAPAAPPTVLRERVSREAAEPSARAPTESETFAAKLETEGGLAKRTTTIQPPSREAKPSRSRERLRPEPDREVLELKRQLEEHRQKQNEIIRKRAEDDKRKEVEEEVRRKIQEEMRRVIEEKEKMAEKAKLEQARSAMREAELAAQLARQEEEARRRKREEELRERLKTEIMEELDVKARVKTEEMAREARIREEAFQLFERERKAKKEAAAAKRKAKKEQETREAEIYLEAEANAREKILAELKAGVPRRKLRALLGISDSEDSDVERRLIEGAIHSDSDSSVATRKQETRRLKVRRSSSSCSSCFEGDSTTRVIVEEYRRSPGGSMHRVDDDAESIGEEDEVADTGDVISQDAGSRSSSRSRKSEGKRVSKEEGPEVVPTGQEGLEESEEAAPPPQPERAPDSATMGEPEGTPVVATSLNNSAEIVDASENGEKIEGQDKENKATEGEGD